MSLRLSSADALFLDFDGTLVEFASTPEAVVVSRELQLLLQAWNKALSGAVCLVSGRSLDSLRALVDLPLCMAGSHGSEWWYGRGEVESLALENPSFCKLKTQLQAFAREENLLAEDKGHSLAMHFRQSPEKEAALDTYIDRQLQGVTHVRLIKGNCVREIQPQGVDKGTALGHFMQNAPFKGRRPVYLGDDTTDEDAFAWVNQRSGLSVKVGSGETCAQYRLSHCGEVFAFLTTQLKKLDE